MQIQLKNIGKRYNYEWIFRNVNYDFLFGNHYAILGANGSGKSTLLQVLAGSMIPSEGEINYHINNIAIESENIFSKVSYAAPYIELFEGFTLKESIDFQKQFKPFINQLSTDEIIDMIGLHNAKDKMIKYFSSGMKQRTKLALAILANTPFLLLDEPTSNLDKNAIEWYQSLIQKHSTNRIIIVCSNQIEQEYLFCNKIIQIEDYKSSIAAAK